MTISSIERIGLLAEIATVRTNLHSESSAIKKIGLLTEIAALREKLGIGLKTVNEVITPATHNEDPLLEQYRNGDFNEQSADDFKATIKKVAGIGMDILELRAGVDHWFDYDVSRNTLSATH